MPTGADDGRKPLDLTGLSGPNRPTSLPSPPNPSAATSSLLRNVLSNWTNLAAMVLYALIITPVVIAGLNDEYYGIWSWLNALVAYSSLFYFGLGTVLMRYGSTYYATDNRAALNRLVSMVMTIYSTFGVVLLVSGIAVAPYVAGFLLDNPTRSTARVITATTMILAVRLSLLFVATVFSGVLTAEGRADLRNLVTIGGHLSRLAIVPFAVGTANPLVMLALAVTVTAAVEVLALVVLTFRTDRLLVAKFVLPTSVELRLLYGFGFLAFLVHVSDRLISYTDTTIIGLALGPVEVGRFALSGTLVDNGRLLVFGIASVMLPHIAALEATGDPAKMRRSYVRTVKITAFVGALVNVTLIALGPMFIFLWVGPNFSQKALPLLACLGGAAFVQAAAVQCQMPFCIATGGLRFAVLILGAEALANLVLSLILVGKFGITGVALGQLVPATLISGLFLPVYMARRVGVPLRQLWSQVVIPVAWFVAILAAGQLLMQAGIGGQSYGNLVIRALLTGMLAVATAWLLASHSERRMLVVVTARAAQSLRLVRYF